MIGSRAKPLSARRIMRTLLPKRWRMTATIFSSASRAPIASIAFTIPQLGKQRNRTAKTVNRQVTVLAIVAVKVGSFLAAVQRIISGIKIQHDLGTFTRNGFDSTLD